jgi:hypothetical protein
MLSLLSLLSIHYSLISKDLTLSRKFSRAKLHISGSSFHLDLLIFIKISGQFSIISFINIIRLYNSKQVRLAVPLTPITPRAPSREGQTTTLSQESNHKLSVPWYSPGKASLTTYNHLNAFLQLMTDIGGNQLFG